MIDQEPVLVAGAISAFLTVISTLGLGLTADQSVALSALVTAVAALLVRRKVSPTGNAVAPAVVEPVHEAPSESAPGVDGASGVYQGPIGPA